MNTQLTLVDCVARYTREPTTLKPPTEAERTSLRFGDYAALVFEVDTPEARHTEQMWVRVTGRVDGRYTGILANEPVTTLVHAHITIGAPVQFSPEHVSDTIRSSLRDRTGLAINDILIDHGIVDRVLIGGTPDDLELFRDLANGLRDPACPVSRNITSPICEAIDAILAGTVTEEHVVRLQALLAPPATPT